MRTPRKADHVKVDPDEYRALVHLRDIAHEELRTRYESARHTADECRRVNQAQLDRIVLNDLEITSLRAQRARATSDLITADKRIAELLAEVAALKGSREPVRSSEVQPLFDERRR